MLSLVWLLAFGLVVWGGWARYYRWANPRAPRRYSGPVPWVGCAVAFGKGPPVAFVEECAKEGDVFTIHVAGRQLTFVLNPDYFPVFFDPDEQASGVDFAHATQPFLTRCFGVPAADYFAGHRAHLTHLRQRLSPARLDDVAARLERALLHHQPTGIDDAAAATLLLLLAPARAPLTVRNFRNVLQRISFAASVRALFGDRVADTPRLYERFVEFDDWFELASSDVPHVFLPAFTSAKRFLTATLQDAAADWSRPSSTTNDDNDDNDSGLFARTVLGDKSPADGAAWLLGVLWASQANTMVSLFWYVLDLMRHPAYTARAVDEARQAHARHGGRWSAACLADCRLLLAALKESVRLHAAPIIVRATLRPVELGPYVVPKGHFLCLSPLLSHRRHDLFAEATSWNPQRWLDHKDPESQWKRFANISFGSSVYRCPGQHYAYTQLVMIAAVLFTRYDLSLDGDVPAAKLDCLVGVQKPVADIVVTLTPHSQ